MKTQNNETLGPYFEGFEVGQQIPASAALRELIADLIGKIKTVTEKKQVI